jgi:thioredoxin reductase (NADPH)
MTRKVVILGSGCAGSTAAIYSARANLEPLVLEGIEPGGQLSLTSNIENFPGFPDGISGLELVENMKKQAQRFGAEYRMENVEEVDLSNRPFTIKTGQETYQTQSLIIASGASAQLIGLESEKALLGRGVSTCATCDGFFYKGREVVVVGGGDTAMEDALYLTKFCKKVTVVHRRDQLRASQIMGDRAQSNPKITFLWDSVVTEILDPKKDDVEAVRIKNVKTGEETLYKTNGVFVAIGHKPNTAIFKGQLDLNSNGYMVVHDGSRTNIEGVFAAGDVHDEKYRQAITAAGSGCGASIECERYLEELDIA